MGIYDPKEPWKTPEVAEKKSGKITAIKRIFLPSFTDIYLTNLNGRRKQSHKYLLDDNFLLFMHPVPGGFSPFRSVN